MPPTAGCGPDGPQSAHSLGRHCPGHEQSQARARQVLGREAPLTADTWAKWVRRLQIMAPMSIEPIRSTDPVALEAASPERVSSGPTSAMAPPRQGLALSEFEGFLSEAGAAGEEPRSLRAWLDLAEAWKITKTLRECRGNRSAAARALGIGRRTLYAKMDKLQIAPTWAMRTQGAGED